MNHSAITDIVSAQGGYGKGISPNPYAEQNAEWARRSLMTHEINAITHKIEMLYEPRFITTPETSELIERLVTMTDSRKVLEIGTHTGFTSMHILRALVGKPGATLVSIDARPAHDVKFFKSFSDVFTHVADWTPQCLASPEIASIDFDLVFVDSDHSIGHTKKEFAALWAITHPGSILLFHDLPEWSDKDRRQPPEVRVWLESLVGEGLLRGLVLPGCEQQDCVDAFGAGYDRRLNPGLGVFIRK